MLAIELDGSQHYEQNQMEYDNERTEFLNQFGIEVLRIPNADIDINFNAACKKITQTIALRSPPPHNT